MRPRQDYTHRVMLNDCVCACWSPMYQCLTLTLLIETVTCWLQGTVGDFSSHFHTLFCVLRFGTLVSVLWFSYFSIFHLPWICIVLEAVLFKTSWMCSTSHTKPPPEWVLIRVIYKKLGHKKVVDILLRVGVLSHDYVNGASNGFLTSVAPC